MNECHIYIETSLNWPKKGNAIVGIIFTDEGDEHSKTLFGQVKDCNTNLAILSGLKNALKYCESFTTIHFHLSNSYVAGGFGRLAAWEASNWLTSRKQPVKYASEWQCISEELKGKTIEIHLDQFNGYYKWLKSECINRAVKHGFIF